MKRKWPDFGLEQEASEDDADYPFGIEPFRPRARKPRRRSGLVRLWDFRPQNRNESYAVMGLVLTAAMLLLHYSGLYELPEPGELEHTILTLWVLLVWAEP
jgi:hypothetical protein